MTGSLDTIILTYLAEGEEKRHVAVDSVLTLQDSVEEQTVQSFQNLRTSISRKTHLRALLSRRKWDTHLPACIPSHDDVSFMRIRSFLTPASSYSRINSRAFDTIASLSKDNLQEYTHHNQSLLSWRTNANDAQHTDQSHHLASTSVETRPGTILRISQPNSTKSLSIAWFSCVSMSLCTSQWKV